MIPKNQITMFELKTLKKQIQFKICTGDVLNQNLYLGDDKGNIHVYHIQVGQNDIISRKQTQNGKNICKSKIDKILCYKEISVILILSDNVLYYTDSQLKKSSQKGLQILSTKVVDFTINQKFTKQEQHTCRVVVITKKKQGLSFFYDLQYKRFQQSKNKFSVSEIPSCIACTGKFVVMATKKQYQSISLENNIVTKGSFQTRYPFVRTVGYSQLLFMTDDAALLMNPQFQPKPKDTIILNKPIQQIGLSGNYCFILCDTAIVVYQNYQKKSAIIQTIAINPSRGITNNRPFIYSKEQLYFLYQIPYQTQIKALLDKCRVQDAITLLTQKVGQDERKIQQLKNDAVWPLLKKMNFDKAKQLVKSSLFDIRQLILLYPQLLSKQPMNSMKQVKAEKTMATLINQYVGDKPGKEGKDSKEQEVELKKKSKLYLKQVLQNKRQYYLQQGISMKMNQKFTKSKNSLIKTALPAQIKLEELLQLIDFTLIKWYFQMNMFANLQHFLLNNQTLHCLKYFNEFQQNFRTNTKIMEVPTLKPRLFAAFQKYDEALDNWQKIAQASTKSNTVKIACQQSVNILTKYQYKNGIQNKLDWILKLCPEIGMTYYKIIPLNSIQPEIVVKKFQKQQNYKFLQLFLEILVIQKNTQIQSYHTTLILLYLDNLIKSYQKQQNKNNPTEYQEKINKFRKFQKNNNARYAAQAILKKIDKYQWLLEDQIYLYSRQKRHQQALKKYIQKNKLQQAVNYCHQNGEQTLTIYFKMLLGMYRSYQSSKNSATLLVQKDIIKFLSQQGNNPQLDPIVVLEQIPDHWTLNDNQGGVYKFLESAITHTLHQKRATYTAKYLSQMDLLNAQCSLVQAKQAYLRFTFKKKCSICSNCIADKFFVVYPNAVVCHQACVKKNQNSMTVCPITKQDFQKTFKY